MKNFTSLLVMLTVAVSICFAKPKEPKSDIKIITVKSHSVYFKVDHSFVGGTVEVYDASQKLLETEKLPHTHAMIIFNDKPSGKYFVKVRKGRKVIEFGYVHI